MTGRPRLCRAGIVLAPDQVTEAMLLDRTNEAAPSNVKRGPDCYLEQHNGEHHAFVMELPGPTAGGVWAVWATGQRPYLVVLPHCPEMSDDARQDGCGGYKGHLGRHAWQTYLGRPGVPAQGDLYPAP